MRGDDAQELPAGNTRPDLRELLERRERASDHARSAAAGRRHERGFRTARENLADLIDEGSLVEYGALAVAAQRGRRPYEELQRETPGDGVITALARVNGDFFPPEATRAAVVVYDYSVLAGTQGFFHHAKIDRILAIARRQRLPVVMYTEGGGGRPGDTDVTIQIAGLRVGTFAAWASLNTGYPRIAVANGYCFAGNAALFGAADLRIATRSSCIGMAGPAMIEGGGLGSHAPSDIGPASLQERNGVIDVLVEDEAAGTAMARRLLWYFQGDCPPPVAVADQATLRTVLPADRRWGYAVRPILETLFDQGSVTELRRVYGRSVITALARLDGRAVGVLASDCQQLGGAVDSDAADKATRFLALCDRCDLPVITLVDTPGFMVGPASEAEGAVHRMSALFQQAATLRVPILTVFLRKAYGLGAMALVGGSFAQPDFAVAWPSGEFGGMGLEGAVRLGYRKELEAAASGPEREALFDRLVAELYEKGKALEAAAHLEIDAVIDPAETRTQLIGALDRRPAGRRERGGSEEE